MTNPERLEILEQPAFEQLIQITRTLAHDYEFVYLVLASMQGDAPENAHFIEVSAAPEFRNELQETLREGAARGLLGWELRNGTLQAKSGFFPWNDESLREWFDRFCEAGVERVGFELDQHRGES